MNLFDYFGDMNVFGAAPDARAQSLLDAKLIGPEVIEAAKKRSIGTGIMTGIASYLAQPKTGNYGSALPYIGKAYLNANQAAQAPFQGIADKYLMDLKIAENKRAQELQREQDLFRENYPLTGATTQIDPNQQVNIPSFDTQKIQDNMVGSSLMGGRTTPMASNSVAPMFNTVPVTAPTANKAGVSTDQLQTTQTAPDSELVRAEQAYKAGIINFSELMSVKASLAKADEFMGVDTDKDIVSKLTGKKISTGIPKNRKITTEELNNNVFGKLPTTVNGRQAIWYLKDNVPVNVNKSDKALVENTIGLKGDGAADKKLSTGIAEGVQKNYTAAEAALMSNNSLDDLIGITEEGVYAGRGSEIKLGLVEYGVQFGFIEPDEQEAIKAMGTKSILQIIAQQQLDEAKANRGQGTLSDAERAIMADARLGRIDTTNKEQLAMLAHTLKKLNAYKVVYHFDRLKAARKAIPESDNRLNYYGQVGKYDENNIDELRQSLTRKAKLQTIDGKQQFVVNDEVQNLDVSNRVVSGGRFIGFSK